MPLANVDKVSQWKQIKSEKIENEYMNRQLQRKKTKVAKTKRNVSFVYPKLGSGLEANDDRNRQSRQIDRQTDKQSTDSLSFLSPVWVSVSIYLSLFLRLVSICVMRKRKFSEYEIAFISFQTVGECSLTRIPSSPNPPPPATPPLAWLAKCFSLLSY